MILDSALLNTQHYKVRIKGKVEQSRNGVYPPLQLGVVAIEKGAFGSPSTKVADYTYFICYPGNFFFRTRHIFYYFTLLFALLELMIQLVLL